MKTLYYFPVIHTEADMGALRDSIIKLSLYKWGQAAFKRKKDFIDGMWDKIELTIENLELDYEKVRLYQDGLPVCGREEEIIRDLAAAGSRNHRLLLRLMGKGAKIMGTESSEFLVEEYKIIQEVLKGGDAQYRNNNVRHDGTVTNKKSPKTLSDQLLDKRDRFIAERINSTLGDDETGILFLGMLHSIEKLLDMSIRVVYPISRPH